MRRLSCLSLLLIAALSLTLSPTHARGQSEPDPEMKVKIACVDAHTRAQELRLESKLVEAERELIKCAQEACPDLLRQDCVGWLDAVKNEQSTVIFNVLDENGSELESARIFIDGRLVTEQLDGSPTPVNPGSYKVRVERDDGMTREKEIVVKQREKNRAFKISFAERAIKTFRDFERATFDSFEDQDRLPMNLSVFGDASVLATSDVTRPSEVVFALGQVGLLAAADLGASIRVLTELIARAEPDGASVDIERLALSWALEGGAFGVRFGLLHTGLGFWNQAYHNGAWLQITVDRPRIVAFEGDGGALPMRSVGVELAGRVGGFNAQFTVANGRGDVPDDLRIVDDTGLAKSVALNLFFESDDARLRVGASGLYDHIERAPEEARPGTLGGEMNELIGNAYVAYLSDHGSVIGEYYGVFHSSARPEGWQLHGGFILGAYRFGIWMPYARVEAVFLGEEGLSPFFSPSAASPGTGLDRDIVDAIAGLRVDVTQWSAFKLEYQLLTPLKRGDMIHTGLINWAFGI